MTDRIEDGKPLTFLMWPSRPRLVQAQYGKTVPQCRHGVAGQFMNGYHRFVGFAGP